MQNKLVVLGVLMDATDVGELKGNVVFYKLRVGERHLSVMDMANEVFDLILENGWREFSLLGYDVGGMVCMQLGLLLNGRDDMTCTNLTVIGSSPVSPGRGRLMTLLNNLDPVEYRKVAAGSSSNVKARDYSLEAQSLQAGMKENGKQDITLNWKEYGEKLYETVVEFNILDQLSLLRIPLAIIHGSDDKIIDPLYSHMLNDAVASSSLDLVTAGHIFQL